MPSLHQVVDRLYPTLMHFGAGPFWVGIHGDIGVATPSWEADEIFAGIDLRFYRGCFECWVPGLAVSAVILVAPCQVVLDPCGLMAGVRVIDGEASDPNGIAYVGGSRSGEVSGVIVGPDGPTYSGPLAEGHIVGLVRAKWDLSHAPPMAGTAGALRGDEGMVCDHNHAGNGPSFPRLSNRAGDAGHRRRRRR